MDIITAERAREISNKEDEFDRDLRKIDTCIRKEAKKGYRKTEINFVYINEGEIEIKIDEIVYDNRVIQRIIKELRSKGFRIEEHLKPCRDRFEVGKPDRITIRW